MKAGYDKHPTKSTVEWTTPKEIIQALGPFDLDPCTHKDGMPWPTAEVMWTKKHDGLAMPWPRSSFVWHNPPYGRGQESWMQKAAEHGHGLTLVLSRTDTKWFHRYVFGHPNARAVLFTQGRIQFCNRFGEVIGGCPAGSVFVAYGDEARGRLEKAVAGGELVGAFLSLSRVGKVAISAGLASNEE